MLQEMLEAEMEASIGYPINGKEDAITSNKRNGYSPKTIKSQYGELPLEITAVYPQAVIQRCIIHMLRNSFKYLSYKDSKKFASDFKSVYKAPTEEVALSALAEVKETWGTKCPYAINNWEMNWENVRPFFEFNDDIRRIMYTTNIIEAVNRQFRKVTKTKSVFPTDTSLEKMLYLASQNIMKKSTQRYRNWDRVLSQLMILYPERLQPYL